MAIILLSIIESASELISGIPEYVSFETDIPSTVFYTLNGLDPDVDSEIAVGNVYLSTNSNTVTLKAIAISGLLQSDIIENQYSTNEDNLDRNRLINEEGISVLPPGDPIVDFISFDEDGDIVEATSIPFVDLDIKTSTTDSLGVHLKDNTTIDFIQFPIKEIENIQPFQGKVSSPNDNNVNFDPKAGLIIIDGFTSDNFHSQVVRIINKPYNTIALNSDFYNEHLSNHQLVTGNFVRNMYNPVTGKIVFYYYESRENRWIKSIQKIEPKSLNLTPRSTPNQFVFKWIDNRYASGIF